MSIIGTENYGNYVMYESQPEWIRKERYEFCEEYKEATGILHETKAGRMLLMVLQILF